MLPAQENRSAGARRWKRGVCVVCMWAGVGADVLGNYSAHVGLTGKTASVINEDETIHID